MRGADGRQVAKCVCHFAAHPVAIAGVTPSKFAGHSMLPPQHAKAARWGPRCCAHTIAKAIPQSRCFFGMTILIGSSEDFDGEGSGLGAGGDEGN